MVISELAYRQSSHQFLSNHSFDHLVLDGSKFKAIILCKLKKTGYWQLSFVIASTKDVIRGTHWSLKLNARESEMREIVFLFVFCFQTKKKLFHLFIYLFIFLSLCVSGASRHKLQRKPPTTFVVQTSFLAPLFRVKLLLSLRSLTSFKPSKCRCE